MMNKRHLALIFVLLCSATTSCRRIDVDATAIPGNGTVTIPIPEDIDCWFRHPTTPQPPDQRKIWVRMFVKSTYMNGSFGETTLSTTYQDIQLDNTSIFPITKNITIAQNRLYTVTVTFTAIECAECALGWGGASSPTDVCTAQVTVGAAGTLYYRGAKAQWEGQGSGNPGQATVNLSRVKRILNYPSSCGCLVN